MTNSELIEYYKELLIIQYNDKPKARATIEAVSDQLIFFEIMENVANGFQIGNSVGKQLDILAKYSGVDRVVVGLTFSRAYFGFSKPGEVDPFQWKPFAKYGEVSPVGRIRDYKESQQSEYNLTDQELRKMIQLAIIKNNFQASLKETDIILNQIFGPGVYMDDNLNMSITFYTDSLNERFLSIAASMELLPVPAGVSHTIVVI